MLTLLIVILIIVALTGGTAYNGGVYANYGYGLGGILVLLLILALLHIIVL